MCNQSPTCFPFLSQAFTFTNSKTLTTNFCFTTRFLHAKWQCYADDIRWAFNWHSSRFLISACMSYLSFSQFILFFSASCTYRFFCACVFYVSFSPILAAVSPCPTSAHKTRTSLLSTKTYALRFLCLCNTTTTMSSFVNCAIRVLPSSTVYSVTC